MAEKPLVALVDLYVAGGVRAHNAGDVVPAENVERNGWSDLVARGGTKAAAEAAAAAPAAPAAPAEATKGA